MVRPNLNTFLNGVTLNADGTSTLTKTSQGIYKNWEANSPGNYRKATNPTGLLSGQNIVRTNTDGSVVLNKKTTTQAKTYIARVYPTSKDRDILRMSLAGGGAGNDYGAYGKKKKACKKKPKSVGKITASFGKHATKKQVCDGTNAVCNPNFRGGNWGTQGNRYNAGFEYKGRLEDKTAKYNPDVQTIHKNHPTNPLLRGKSPVGGNDMGSYGGGTSPNPRRPKKLGNYGHMNLLEV